MNFNDTVVISFITVQCIRNYVASKSMITSRTVASVSLAWYVLCYG